MGFFNYEGHFLEKKKKSKKKRPEGFKTEVINGSGKKVSISL